MKRSVRDRVRSRRELALVNPCTGTRHDMTVLVAADCPASVDDGMDDARLQDVWEEHCRRLQEATGMPDGNGGLRHAERFTIWFTGPRRGILGRFHKNCRIGGTRYQQVCQICCPAHYKHYDEKTIVHELAHAAFWHSVYRHRLPVHAPRRMQKGQCHVANGKWLCLLDEGLAEFVEQGADCRHVASEQTVHAYGYCLVSNLRQAFSGEQFARFIDLLCAGKTIFAAGKLAFGISDVLAWDGRLQNRAIAECCRRQERFPYIRLEKVNYYLLPFSKEGWRASLMVLESSARRRPKQKPLHVIAQRQRVWLRVPLTRAQRRELRRCRTGNDLPRLCAPPVLAAMAADARLRDILRHYARIALYDGKAGMLLAYNGSLVAPVKVAKARAMDAETWTDWEAEMAIPVKELPRRLLRQRVGRYISRKDYRFVIDALKDRQTDWPLAMKQAARARS